MFQLQINEKGGPSRQETFDKAEITIGRVQGNDIILPKGNISKRHSRIVLKEGKFIIVDLKSTNGTYVNGKKITAPQVIKATDKIYIGDFTIQLAANGGGASVAPAEQARPPAPPKEEEIDIFGGDAPVLDEPPARTGAPGLIDDNFDQEFDAPEPPPAKLSKPSSKRTPPPKPPEPEPLDAGPEFDLDDDFGDPLGDGEPDPLALLADEPDPIIPDPEPEPPAAPTPVPEVKPASVLPMKKKASRAGPSRIRPIPTRSKNDPQEDEALGPLAEADAPPTTMPEPALAEPATAAPTPSPVTALPLPAQPAATTVVAAASSVEALSRLDAIEALHVEVVEEMGLRGVDIARLPAMKAKITQTAQNIGARMQASGKIAQTAPLAEIAQAAAAAAVGLEPIIDLMQDELVVEFCITYDRHVLADREGHLQPIGRKLASEQEVENIVRSLGVLAGAKPSAKEPLVNVRMRDGSRVIASLPPLSFRGPTLSYRKTTRDFFTIDRLLNDYSTISPAMKTFIDYCVRFRKNILLSVGAGVSPTATMNALVDQMPTDDRVVTVENGIELHLERQNPSVVTLVPTADFGVRTLIQHAVNSLADRAVVGDLKGVISEEMLTSIAGPLEGSICAFSAVDPQQAIYRIAGELEGDEVVARKLVAATFPVVLHERKFLDESRRITSISEVFVEGDEIVVEEIFRFKPEGVDENFVVAGSFLATGHTPRFLEELVDRGEADVDLEIFKA